MAFPRNGIHPFILLLEEDEVVSRLYKALLNKYFPKTALCSFQKGEDLVRFIRDHLRTNNRRPIQLVISSFELTNSNGYEVYLQIRQLFEEVVKPMPRYSIVTNSRFHVENAMIEADSKLKPLIFDKPLRPDVFRNLCQSTLLENTAATLS